MVNLENIKKAVQLQKEANAEINLFGCASNIIVDEMLELINDFNSFEEDMFIELMSK
jgi:UDP-N-acetylenolpyruvoylglucosamine reductase